MGIRDFPVCMDIWKTLIAEFPTATTPQKIKDPFPKQANKKHWYPHLTFHPPPKALTLLQICAKAMDYPGGEFLELQKTLRAKSHWVLFVPAEHSQLASTVQRLQKWWIHTRIWYALLPEFARQVDLDLAPEDETRQELNDSPSQRKINQRSSRAPSYSILFAELTTWGSCSVRKMPSSPQPCCPAEWAQHGCLPMRNGHFPPRARVKRHKASLLLQFSLFSTSSAGRLTGQAVNTGTPADLCSPHLAVHSAHGSDAKPVSAAQQCCARIQSYPTADNKTPNIVNTEW